MRIAVMQPYYYPYAGYFRLFAATDLFVVLDCVQFNRRGRVHRYQRNDGKWITLPIKKTDRDTTRIMDLQWRDKEEAEITPVDFIIGTMQEVCERLNIPFNIVRSSSMDIPEHIRGQARIITICNNLDADEYVNSSGGVELYDHEAFAEEGIQLTFLPEYSGGYGNILERLVQESPAKIREEIYANI